MYNTPTNRKPMPPIDRTLYSILGPHIVWSSSGRIFAVCENRHQHLALATLKAKGYTPKHGP